jgi:hypothetical protein
MLFDATYPPALAPVLPLEEWEGLMRHLNTDLNQHIQRSLTNLHSWTTGLLASSTLLVGIFIVPVVWVKTSRHVRAMKAFWEEVREYFGEVNKKTFIRRGLEWKVVEERKKQAKRDCYNPVYLMRVELVWRQNVVKSKKEMARLMAAGSGASGGSNTSTGTTGTITTTSSTRRKSKRLSASRPPSNIGSVKEVSPEREAAVDPLPATTVIPPAEAPAADAAADAESSSSESEAMVLPSRPVSGIAPKEAPRDDDPGLFLSDSEPEEVK